MKELKDYLHLYLGCECVCGDQVETLSGIEINGDGLAIIETKFRGNLINYYYEHEGFDGLKLSLRPFSDMTEKEGIEYAQLYCKKKFPDDCLCKISKHNSGGIQVSIEKGGSGLSLFPGGPHGSKPESFRYLLSKHFDIFGLIESGLAIDATRRER